MAEREEEGGGVSEYSPLRCVALRCADKKAMPHPGAANGETGHDTRTHTHTHKGKREGVTYVEDDLPDEVAVGEVLVPEVEVGNVAYCLEGRHRR